MASITILGKVVPIEFLVGKGEDLPPMIESKIIAGAEEMAALINSKQWSAEQERAFTAMNKIIFFEGVVTDNDGHEIERPGCDQNDAIFYWEANEFTFNPDADVRGNTYFHDCWHVIQFRDSGNTYARGEDEMAAREVDAINHQIEVGRILGNDAREIGFLENFRDDQSRIRERLREGVDKAGPHSTTFLKKN